MSTSLLYHAFGIRGYQYTRTQYQGGRIFFTIHQGPESCCLLLLRLGTGHPPRPSRAPIPIPAYRRPRDLRGLAHPTR